jgi:hypothetical protein
MTASRSQPITERYPLPWVVGPFGDIWVAADVEFHDGKWRETRPEPRIVVTIGSLDRDKGLAAFIVEAVNSHATLKARVAELEGALRIVMEKFSFTIDGCDCETCTAANIAHAALSHAGPVARDGEQK